MGFIPLAFGMFYYQGLLVQSWKFKDALVDLDKRGLRGVRLFVRGK